MRKIRFIRGLAGLAMLSAGLAPPPVSAQTAVPCPCATVVAQCCQCVDGSVRQSNLNTGFAPWYVQGPSGGAAQPVAAAGNSAWNAPIPPATWVGPPGGATAPGIYTYTLQYFIPQCVIPANVFITLEFAADDAATLVGTGFNAAGFSATSVPVVTLPASFNTPGLHTLTIRVNNAGGPTGLRVRATLNTRCPLQQPAGNAVAADEATQQ